MKYSSFVDISAAKDAVHPFVNDLSRYPQWMPLVHSAESCGEDVWDVELRAKVGVFARSKRLRMRRTIDDGTVIVFERDENDGKQRSPWIMRVVLESLENGCRVRIDLSYGGSLWTGGVLDRVLASHVDAGKEGLRSVVQGA